MPPEITYVWPPYVDNGLREIKVFGNNISGLSTVSLLDLECMIRSYHGLRVGARVIIDAGSNYFICLLGIK
jgi:hypothetical protein